MSNRYRVAIKDMPEELRPREKLLSRGEGALSDAELLAVLIGQGTRGLNAVELANQLILEHKGLRNLRDLSIEELMQHKGIGVAKAVTIKAALELAKRSSLGVPYRVTVRSPVDVTYLVMEEMRYFDREYFRVLYLDRKGTLLVMEDVSVGSLHSSIVHPREVFKTAVKRSAASIILVHNHPSGDPSPSKEDIQTSNRLIQAGSILGIEVLDHIIIGDGRYCSMKEKGLI
ncbi:MAG TPA: DNA repair protein RadC [Syntrophomonadaceae bacterium]|nr:DNA repair protein RadC [Syntrophomonadaceae bacterium]